MFTKKFYTLFTYYPFKWFLKFSSHLHTHSFATNCNFSVGGEGRIPVRLDFQIVSTLKSWKELFCFFINSLIFIIFALILRDFNITALQIYIGILYYSMHHYFCHKLEEVEGGLIGLK